MSILKNYYRLKHPLLPRACHFCSSVFTPTKSGGRIYCSDKCRSDSINGRAFKLKPVTCIGCGKSFTKSHSTQIFCSVGCRTVHKESTRQKNNVFHCRKCGKDFTSEKRSWYCSSECKPKKVITDDFKPILDKVCPICGVNFSTTNKFKIVCSISCSRKKYNQRSARPNSSISRLPKQPCESCGFSNLSAIHRHHVNPDQGNAGGIVFLCANCHYIFHGISGWNGTSENKSKQEVLDILKGSPIG